MRLTGRIAAVAFLLFAACSTSTRWSARLTEAGVDDPDAYVHNGDDAKQCRHAAGVDDGGPGASVLVDTCSQPLIACFCDPDAGPCETQCPYFPCPEDCKPEEYMVSWGGLDASSADASAPDGCRKNRVVQGAQYYCCPCL